jgi:membrane dipeptidase
MNKFFILLTLLLVSVLGWSGEELSLSERAKNLHDRILTLDAHADIEIPGEPSSYVGADGLSKVSPKKMREGSLNAVVMSVAVGPKPRTPEGYAEARSIADRELNAVKALVAETANQLVLATKTQQLVDARKSGQNALLLGLQNALILGTEIDAIDRFYDAGVRVFALTHMGHNDFADSSRPLFDASLGRRETDAEHGGLSPLGKAAIKRINSLGGIIDISQLSKQAALQAINLSTTSVIASHSNVRTLTNVSRNLSDDEIDRISAKGGVVHIAPFAGYLFDSSDSKLDAAIRAIRRDAGVDEDYLYPFELYWEIKDPEVKTAFLSGIRKLVGPITLDTMLNHLDYVAKRVGVEHVGIGTDFNHGSGIEGYQDATDTLNVTIGLMQRGYSDPDIEKIWGGNFLRVWGEVEQGRQIKHP